MASYSRRDPARCAGCANVFDRLDPASEGATWGSMEADFGFDFPDLMEAAENALGIKSGGDVCRRCFQKVRARMVEIQEQLERFDKAAARDELTKLEARFSGPAGPAAEDYHPDKRAAMQPRIDELREKLGLHFWQRTQAGCRAALGMPEGKHRQHIEAAIEAGKAIPNEVIADYPDLKGERDGR